MSYKNTVSPKHPSSLNKLFVEFVSFFILPRILVCSLQIVQCLVTHSQLNFVCSGIAYEEMSNYSLDKVIMYNN